MLVYRAPLHKHKTLSFCLRLRRAQITVFFSFMHVYRAPLDKHKTLNFDPMQVRKKTLEAFTKWLFGACDTLICTTLGNKHTKLASPNLKCHFSLKPRISDTVFFSKNTVF